MHTPIGTPRTHDGRTVYTYRTAAARDEDMRRLAAADPDPSCPTRPRAWYAARGTCGPFIGALS